MQSLWCVEFHYNNDFDDAVNLVTWFELMIILFKMGQDLYVSDTWNVQTWNLCKFPGAL